MWRSKLAAGTLFLAAAIGVTGPHGQETLGSLAKKRGVYVGAAVGGAFWGGDSRYQETLKREFNIIVAENAMKFDLLQPKRNEFQWKQADDLVAFAARNGMALRGHCLVWHQQSEWLAAASGLGRAEMLSILKNHIDSVMTHFKGRVLEWDVVNEAIDDDGKSLRNTFWLQRIGSDYLDSAFTWAHRADPNAFLFYNDYSGEGMGGKSDRIFALVKGMKDKGIPIHGVGLQAHFASGGSFTTADIDRNMKRLGALGLRVSITELDFRFALPVDAAKLTVQKGNYAAMLGVCLANENCKTFLTWGFTDAHSWVPGFFQGSGAALPFDANYAPKPAYDGMKEALTATPIGLFPARDPRSAPGPGDRNTKGTLPGNFGSEAVQGGVRNALGRWMGF
ncbi:MAG: endo-1,4-beta-xylanase [Fibrobacterota bacterium]|nr:endo-1,4-beta-xylanase [Fibrobacterota bacterium]